jgi:hypothetical protein
MAAILIGAFVRKTCDGARFRHQAAMLGLATGPRADLFPISADQRRPIRTSSSWDKPEEDGWSWGVAL